MSEPIPGTGGSSFVTTESKGAYVSDENNKMALTDALSVAMKALGVAANVYYSEDKNVEQFETKYTTVCKTNNNNDIDAKTEIEQIVKPMVVQANSIEELIRIFNSFLQHKGKPEYVKLFSARRKQLENK